MVVVVSGERRALLEGRSQEEVRTLEVGDAPLCREGRAVRALLDARKKGEDARGRGHLSGRGQNGVPPKMSRKKFAHRTVGKGWWRLLLGM